MKTLTLLVAVAVVLVNGAAAQQGAYAQCGGINWTGGTTCVAGYRCVYSNDYYSQCVPGVASSSATPRPSSSSRVTSSTRTTTTSRPTTSTTTSSRPVTTTATPSRTRYAGVNIAGFDFGCLIDGSCDLSQTKNPATSGGYLNGIGQMQHFVRDDKLNTFRLPVAWQYLATGGPGSTLDAGRLNNYDALIQGCLNTGSVCIIDIHNYARWNGGIIGQGGPTNAQFVSLWTQLATRYRSQPNVWFGIMNEPHGVDITRWAATVQLVVTAIRNAGATSQRILLPGNNFTSAGAFISSGSAAALIGVTNPDGSTTNLIFDVHKYLDFDNSGQHVECVTDNVADAFAPLAAWLRQNRRLAFVSETGGGNVQSCVRYFCSQLAYLNTNADVYLGYTTWSAGCFDFSWNYILTEVPSLQNGVWTDQLLVRECVRR